jgi:hypothetical protein
MTAALDVNLAAIAEAAATAKTLITAVAKLAATTSSAIKSRGKSIRQG